MIRRPKSNLSKVKRFVIIGPGRWGQALGNCIKESGFEIQYLGENQSELECKKILSEQVCFVLISTPFKALPTVLSGLSKIPNIKAVINASKGIDRKSLMSFTQLARDYLKCPIASLSGPSFADELSKKLPTACVIASNSRELAGFLAKKISTPYFRLYAHSDPIGVDLCGAIKNVLAIACGISDGLQLGQNARAALLTRGLVEMMLVTKKLGGKSATVLGLAGVGDLWLTSIGDLSRNRQFGLMLAQGRGIEASIDQINAPIEGYYTVFQIEKLRKKYRLDLPICESVYKICTDKMRVSEALQRLMKREPKFEESSSWRLR
ncbi:MAG: glycerol-3-phosphate dehydrogenase [Deltaproteobacteria bacterium CG11_big_fil_rev_8_21_14_0_20_45_16]|nr:MAG: glycerol-3-phosphate dehydrogenase [Deltaproteobacteria bacterium CG11_big_fil_rev_8_21_14_0_20_45_16]